LLPASTFQSKIQDLTNPGRLCTSRQYPGMGPVSVDWVPTVNRGMPLDRPALVSHTMQRPRGPLSRRCLISSSARRLNSSIRRCSRSCSVSALFIGRWFLSIRAASSSQTLPSQPTWSYGGAFWCGPPILRSPIGWRAGPPREFLPTPWPLQRPTVASAGALLQGRRGFGGRAARNHFRQPGLAGRAAVLLDCVLRPAWLHWALQCPFVAEPGWCVQDVQKTLPLHR
jgi:hypothetical protein